MNELTVQQLIDRLEKIKDKSKWIYPPVCSVEESFEFDDENDEDSGTIVILKGKP